MILTQTPKITNDHSSDTRFDTSSSTKLRTRLDWFIGLTYFCLLVLDDPVICACKSNFWVNVKALVHLCFKFKIILNKT